MTKIGYARVSTKSQDLEGQRTALEGAGCTIIRAEKVSAKSRQGRDELQTILDFVRAGDELVVVRIDRLGRRISDVLNIVDELETKGASLRVLEPPLTTADRMTGQIMVTALGMAAELERTFLRDRQRAGIDRRLQLDSELPISQRAYRGRRRVVDQESILEMARNGAGPSLIARNFGISRMTVYRAIQSGSPTIQSSTASA